MDGIDYAGVHATLGDDAAGAHRRLRVTGVRGRAGRSTFPLAAPTGGTLMIVSWLLLAIAAAWPRPSS